jgi:septum formation protein
MAENQTDRDRNIRLILGSQSPRRKDLLNEMGLEGQYEIIPSDYDEQLDNNRSPSEVAEELGYGKALWVATRNPGAWVIGSDTIVTVEGKQLAKPADEQEAREMLKLLSGRPNTVTSSIALVMVAPNTGNERVIKHYIGHEEATVFFKPFDQALIDEYVASGDWHDKAGGYGIQSGAHTLIESIDGYYDTILGLPTHTLAEFLGSIGIEAHPATLTAPVPAR